MTYQRHFLLCCCLGAISLGFAQPATWTLRQCLEHAHANNLQITQADLRIQESELNRRQSVAALFPSLSASTSVGLSRQNVKNSMNEYMSEHSLNARYSVGANLTLFNGWRQINNIRQQELNMQLEETDKDNTLFNIDLSIIQAYTQIAYLKESVEVLKSNLEASKAQRDMAEGKRKAGAISQSDFAQMEAQYSKDQYQLVLGENQLQEQLLQLKQLLDLGLNDSIDITSVPAEEAQILTALPDKQYIYDQALQHLPSARYQQLSMESAELNCKMASGSYLPSLSLSASVGTGNWFDSDEKFRTQLNDNLNENLSLSLSVPIFNGLQTRTSVQKAQLSRQNAGLNKEISEKELRSTIENLYNDALAAQSQYRQATAQLASAEASHALVREQYKVGLKNSVELIVSENNYLNAAQTLLQTKYTAALAVKLLQYYQGLPIE
ncbi:MAG: TolC family protein [Bacteroidales bacterium]|nr:TolC family protein [Bacteroidales bacterium]